MATIIRRKQVKGVVYKAVVRRVGFKDKSKTFVSNSILLCEKSNVYDKIFESKLKYFTFDKDLKNFKNQVYSLLKDYGDISDIISSNKKCVYNNHTWENRVFKVIDLINKR